MMQSCPITTKTILLFLMLFMSADMKAQSYNIGIGASVGTDGLGADVAALITDYAAVRAGISIWPKIGVKTNVHINDNNPLIADEVTLEGKPSIFDFKVLADFYPINSSSFHITAGVFIGSSKFLTVTNTTMFIKDPQKYGKVGLTVGDYRLATDENGYIKAEVKSNSVKPYLGVGFGRAVPRKSRVSVSFDLGVQLWGKPASYAWTKNDWDEREYHEIKYSDLDEYDDKHIKDALDFIEKIRVFPVLNVRLSGRLF